MRILVFALCVLLVVDASFVKEALERKILKELLLRKLRDEINTDAGNEQGSAGDTGAQAQQQQQSEQQQQEQGQQEQEQEQETGGVEEAEPTLEDQIHAQEAKYMKYFKEQDYASLANLYTNDSYYYAPGEAAVHGKAEIELKVWVPGGASGPNTDILTFKSVHIIEAGDDYAIGHGEWDVRHNEEVCEKSGKKADGHYLTVYRKVDGEWLIEVDIINTVNVYPGEDADEDNETEDTEAEDNDAEGNDTEETVEEASANTENDVTKKRLVNLLKKMLQKRKKTTPGVLHRLGKKSHRN